MKKQKISGYCDKKSGKKNVSISKETGLYAVTLEVKILAYGDPKEMQNNPQGIGNTLWNADNPADAFIFKNAKKITKIDQINNDSSLQYVHEFDNVFVTDSGYSKIEKSNNLEEKNDDGLFIEPGDANVEDIIYLEKIC